MLDYENELLLITGASGRQATELIPHVINKWKHIRLAVNSSSSKERLGQTYPNAEVVQTDLADPKACERLLEGVTCCFFVAPPFHPHETTIGYNIIDACLANQRFGGPFTHIVYSSVIFPILRKLLNHDCKRYVEEYLVESGLDYTILQPTHLMETMPLAMLIDAPEPVYSANWDPTTKFSFVSCKDVGEAAANILKAREKHYFGTYQLVGTPQPLNYVEVLQIVSQFIGKEVTIKQRSFGEAADIGIKILTGGKEPPFATKEIGSRMFLYYSDRGLIGNPNVLEMLLGHQTIDYKSWAEKKVKEIQAQK